MQEIEIKNSGLGATVPEGWKELRLQDATNHFKSGLGITSEFISEEGEYSVYGGNGLRGFTDNFTHDGEYILIGRQGALCGNIQIVSGKNYISEHAIAVTTNEANDLKFLAYKLEFRNLNRLSESSAQPGLSVEKLVRIKLDFPPLPEQQAIADCLSTWDEAIQTAEELIRQKELQKKWLMQQLMSGKKRLKGFSGEWRETELKTLFDRVTQKNNEGNTNVVTISAQRGFVIQTEFFNKAIASDILDNYFLVERGDFCYNKSYSKGYPWGATKRLTKLDKAVVTTLYICFRLKYLSRSSAEYFEHFFQANSLDKGLMKIAHEGGRAHGLLNVTPSDFFGLKILTPEFEEQQAIASILSESDRELDLLRKRLAKLQEQKKGLMQVLLTGKRRLRIKEL
jgi:type I restriction enzyme S subunit